jgi:hypothetical protein
VDELLSLHLSQQHDVMAVAANDADQANLSLNEASYSWRFLLADVKFPILGVDFL